jgi:hypothetical protein
MSRGEVFHADIELSASLREQEERQRAALQTVRVISRMAGRELPIVPSPEGDVSEQQGIYLLDASVIEKGRIKDTAFDFRKKMLSGAADSAHAVIAGDLQVDYASGLSETTEIAAKCYQKRTFADRLTRARKEVETTKFMQQHGEITLDPVAVAIAPENVSGGAVVLLTRFQEGLYTLDNTPWNRGPNRGNTANAIAASNALGRFNSRGRAHNDAKIKNVAASSDGRVSMIDFETCELFDTNQPIEAASAAHADFGLLVESLVDKGMFRPRMDKRTFADNLPQIKSTLNAMGESYFANWSNAPFATQELVYDMICTVIDNVVQQSALQPAHA